MKQPKTPEATLELAIQLEQTQKDTKTMQDSGGNGNELSGNVTFEQENSGSRQGNPCNSYGHWSRMQKVWNEEPLC